MKSGRTQVELIALYEELGSYRAVGALLGCDHKTVKRSQVMLPALEVAPPPWKSEPKEIAIDALHHAVYAVATGVAFAALDR